ncbi:zincin-like metallopeptidase domain-containing protein, partial [Proteus mirabilis]|uniref:zincin-like metallopeptidase domain-containing protein n=1 Tax=Proteus mirabilis TaxID=584 RepID=UPI001EE9FA26
EELYSFEERVAEMGSAVLYAQLRVEEKVKHESKLDSWLRVLKSDKKALFRAAGQARQACEFLLNVAASRQAA